MERPQRNVVNNLSNDIFYQDCATVCAQLSCTASFDVWGFDAASDVPPTQLHSRAKWEKEIFRKGQRCIEKTQAPCQRETHSVAQSLALQMLAIGSVNGPHAYRLNPSIVRGLRSSRTVRQSVGVESGSSVVQRLESTVDMCGIQGFPLITAKCQSEDVAARKQNKA